MCSDTHKLNEPVFFLRPVSFKLSAPFFGHGCWNMQVHLFELNNILFHSTYQDEHTVKYSPHCFPHISYLGTDEENLVNIKELFFLTDHVLLFLEPLIYV